MPDLPGVHVSVSQVPFFPIQAQSRELLAKTEEESTRTGCPQLHKARPLVVLFAFQCCTPCVRNVDTVTTIGEADASMRVPEFLSVSAVLEMGGLLPDSPSAPTSSDACVSSGFMGWSSSCGLTDGSPAWENPPVPHQRCVHTASNCGPSTSFSHLSLPEKSNRRKRRHLILHATRFTRSCVCEACHFVPARNPKCFGNLHGTPSMLTPMLCEQVPLCR